MINFEEEPQTPGTPEVTPEIIEEPTEVVPTEVTPEPTEVPVEVTPTEEIIEVDPLVLIANGALDAGIINQIPEDVNPDNIDQESLIKTLQYNQQLAVESALDRERQDLASRLTETSREILGFNLDNTNATDEEILDYVASKLRSREITSLDPDAQPEQVIRTYYAGMDWTAEQINDQIKLLIESEKLVEHAKVIKPKLDLEAQRITDAKARQQRAIADKEAQQYDQLKARTEDIIRTGKLMGQELTNEEAGIAYHAVLNQDVDVPVRGGKTIKLGMMEAMLYQHRYGQNGSLENLMLAAIVLQKGPEALNKFLGKKAEQKVIKRFKRESLASNREKTGATSTPRGEGSLFSLKLK